MKIKLWILIALAAAVFNSCNHTSKGRNHNKSSTLAKDSLSDVIIYIDDNTYWMGKARNRYDTVGHINPHDLKETMTVLLIRIREGEWLLKEKEDAILAKNVYLHDSLVSSEVLSHYNADFNNFNHPDTISVTTKW